MKDKKERLKILVLEQIALDDQIETLIKRKQKNNKEIKEIFLTSE